MTQDIDQVKVLTVLRGRAAPDFTATTLDGELFKLSDLRGKVVLLDFWATWCAPCLAELPNLRKLHDEDAAAGLVIVSVSFDRTADAAGKFAAGHQMTWPQIWAEKGRRDPLAELYGVTAIPATILIGPDGKVIDRDLRGRALLSAVRSATSKLKPADRGSETPARE